MITIVKSNPFLSARIGLENKIGDLSSSDFQSYCILVHHFYLKQEQNSSKKAGDNGMELLAQLPKETKKIMDIMSKVSFQSLATLATFGDMGKNGDIYCENFDWRYKQFEEETKIDRTWMIRKIGKVQHAKCVLFGMRVCGQLSYLSELQKTIANMGMEINDNYCESVNYFV